MGRWMGLCGIVPEEGINAVEDLWSRAGLRMQLGIEFGGWLMLESGSVLFHRNQAVLAKWAAKTLRARCSFPRTASTDWAVSWATCW
jgi:hypothetical protein